MTRVLLGMLGGAVLLALTMYVWMRGDDGCLGRCGPGTRCDDHRCVASAESKPAAPVVKERRRRPHKAGELASAQPELHLQPGDEKMTSQGDALGRVAPCAQDTALRGHRRTRGGYEVDVAGFTFRPL